MILRKRRTASVRASRARPAVRSLGALLHGLLLAGGARAATFDVNSALDATDAIPGNGVCEAFPGNGICTLRAAVQESNALPGIDTINLQANTTYLLTLVGAENESVSGSLDFSDSANVVGAGAASTIIDGNGAVTGDRVIQVLPCIRSNCGNGTVVFNLSGVTLQKGRSQSGGGLYVPKISVNGGHAAAQVALTNCRVANNEGQFSGGGIYSEGPFTLIDSVVADNSTGVFGGGADFVSSDTVYVSGSTFSGNDSGLFGGGLLSSGTAAVHVTASTFSGNHAADTGGGMHIASSATVVNSTVSGNSSGNFGGGISVYGTASLHNATVVGNTANADKSGTGNGGGIYVYPGGGASLFNSMLASNSHLTNTLFVVLDDCSGTINSDGYGIVTHATCTINGGYSTAQPLLGPLQNNGGPAPTHALLAGSPGIDAGDPAGCKDDAHNSLATDQRGLPRTVGGACDIGAYEVQPDSIFKNGFDLDQP
jgi:hypothetical protein